MSSNSVKVSYATKKSVPARTSGSQQKTSETRKVTSKKASRAVPGNTLPSRVDSADVMAASSTESVDSVLAVSALTTPAASEVRAHHKSGAAHRRDPGIRSDPSGDPSTKENAAPTIVKNKPTSGAKPASPPLKIKTNLSTGGTPATSVVGDSPDVGSSCSKKWQWCEDSDQMDAVLSYIADITKAFGTRTRTLPPPSSLDNFRATAIPQGRAKLASSEGGRFPILNKLYDASLSLLRAFSQLEYAKVSHKVNLEEMEKNTLEASSLVESLVESVERKFCMHESEEVREAFGSKHQTVDNCHEVVECLVKVARYIVLLRRLCGQHNVARVVDVLEELDIVVRRGANASKSETSTFYQLSVLKGPFFVFLRERWIPTVREWQVVVDRAMESARMGDFEDAVTVAEAAQLSITHLQDILRPDETVSELHRNYIVNPIEEIRLAGEQRRLILQELKNAMAAPGIRPLAKAIRTAQSTPYFSKTSELSSATESSSYSDDLSLFKEAQQMLINLQQVDSITNALNTVHRISSTDSVALFLVLHRANEQINRLGIAESASHSQKVVRASRPVAAKIREDSGGRRSGDSTDIGRTASPMTSSSLRLVELLPTFLTVHDLCIPHVCDSVWTTETSESYHAVAADLFYSFTHECARYDLEKALEDNSSMHTSNAMSPDLSLVNEENLSASPSRSSGAQVAPRVEFLKSKLQRAEELGISGPLIEEARAKLERLQVLRLKVHFESQTRVIHIPNANTAFCDIEKKLYAFCRTQSTLVGSDEVRKLRIRYEDAEGDFISLFNEDDWLIMMNDLSDGGNLTNRIELYCDFLLEPGTACAASPAVPALGPQSQTTPEEDTASSSTYQKAVAASRKANTGKQNVFQRLNSASTPSWDAKKAPEGTAFKRSLSNGPALNNSALLRQKKNSLKRTNSVNGKVTSPPPKVEKSKEAAITPPASSGLTPEMLLANTQPDAGLDVTAAKRWDADEEDAALEINTIASLSTVRPGRSTTRTVPEFVPTAKREAKSANHFTTQDCCRGGGGAKVEEAPRHWERDVDVVDIKTVCSEVSAVPTARNEKVAPPVRTAQRPPMVPPGTRATPASPQKRTASRRGARRADPQNTSDTEGWMQEVMQMREENQRAMKNRANPAWH